MPVIKIIYQPRNIEMWRSSIVAAYILDRTLTTKFLWKKKGNGLEGTRRADMRRRRRKKLELVDFLLESD